MAPYVPPQVTIFYDPQPSASDVHELVTTRERDSFFHFESFYSEPPMTHGESHPYAGEMYHANEFNSALTAFVKSSTLPSDLASDLESAASVVVETPPPEPGAGRSDEEASDEKDGLVEFHGKEDAVVTAAEETCLTCSSKVQLSAAESEEEVAEMAPATEDVQSMMVLKSSNLRMYTKQQLNDLERQFNWERGQIDYLGIDSFDNILKQLEDTINEPLLSPVPMPPPPSSDAKAAATTKEPVQNQATSQVPLPATDESDKINCIPLEE